jgi:hypothetical protein
MPVFIEFPNIFTDFSLFISYLEFREMQLMKDKLNNKLVEKVPM